MITYFKPHNYETTRIVQLGEDDFGLYSQYQLNDFGTRLAARGSFEEIYEFRRWCSLTQRQRAEIKRARASGQDS